MRFDRDRVTFDDTHQRGEGVHASYMSLQEAAKSLPPGRRGRPVHCATIVRWIVNGTSSPSGEIVRLQAIRMGHRWLTTAEWLREFARRLTPSFGESPSAITLPDRRKDDGRVARELDAAGL